MKTALLILVLVLTSTITYAQADKQQYDDVIILKSGTVFRGTIIESIPDVSYKIKQKDGTILEFEARLIEKVMRVPRGSSDESINQNADGKGSSDSKSPQTLFQAKDPNS